MPNIFIEMIEGRTIEQKRELVKKITSVIVDVLKVESGTVAIRILNVKREDWAKGGELWIDRK
jgi:4-oxalocrotonate tautomerase